MKNIWRIIKLIPEYRSRICRVVLISSLLGLAAVAIPYVFKLVVDQVVALSTHQSTAETVSRTLIWCFAALAVLRVVDIIGSYFQERLVDHLWVDTIVSLRQRIFDHLSTLSLDYYEKTRTGEIMQRASNGVMEINSWLNNLTNGIMISLLQIIFIIIYLFYSAPLVGLIVLIMVPLNLWNAINRVKQTKPIRRRWTELSEKYMGKMHEMISQMATVRSFGGEAVLRDSFTENLTGFRSAVLDQNRVQWRAGIFRGSVKGITTLAAVGVVTYGALRGQYTAGDIFLVLQLVNTATSSVNPIARLITHTGDVETAAERIVELLDVPATVVDRPGAEVLDDFASLEFKHVTFNYPGKRRKVLEDVSFKLKRGETLALVGPSGVGKTTITKLLLRFYEPNSGHILINERDIREFTQVSVRGQMGMVMQDVALFNDSIAENLRFARPSATTAELKEAARLAHADIFIDKLPQKFKTLVGERGIKLSGGEKQRVAIARAILRDPQLIVLDEATSALDSESERQVQAGLAELMQGRTAIIIAHRLSTVMKADQIIVLRDGRVIERGTHDQLANRKRGGLYAKLYSLQTSGALK